MCLELLKLLVGKDEEIECGDVRISYPSFFDRLHSNLRYLQYSGEVTYQDRGWCDHLDWPLNRGDVGARWYATDRTLVSWRHRSRRGEEGGSIWLPTRRGYAHATSGFPRAALCDIYSSHYALEPELAVLILTGVADRAERHSEARGPADATAAPTKTSSSIMLEQESWRSAALSLVVSSASYWSRRARDVSRCRSDRGRRL